jgi:hypothetical protein
MREHMYTLMVYFSCTILVHCNILNEFKISACISEVLVLNYDCNTAVLKGCAVTQIISHHFSLWWPGFSPGVEHMVLVVD